MLLLFVLTHLIVFITANPHHKYPYVFLLDVGNEEIDKSDIEQIRLTVPGGSMAVKYPAEGDGDLIGHVRITAIDFGIDLKASIAEGGPGYKYVVIVFSGNPGKSYDAVVSIQTLPADDVDDVKSDDDDNNNDLSNGADDETDDNNNEDTIQDDTGSESMYVTNSQSEVMQSTSNVYKYAVNDVSVSGMQASDNDLHEYDGNEQEEINVNSDDYAKENTYTKDDSSESDSSVAASNTLSDKYIAFKPHIYGGIRFYPQAAVYTQDTYEQNDNTPLSFDDGNQNDYKSNNNQVDDDDALTVDY
ncbi:unnamed protein product [Danaus chrysippus]|uniref:(African queen) hypothetical protein n=1 Tax=Danaus chrysippus TaxID=151541 RepID=A0A8J2QBL6_9NEOP|nr:unnamed protein product [Danaus chrysippus]